MTRRPFAVLCILCIVIMAAMTYFGLPPERGRADQAAVKELLDVPRDVTVTGEVLRSEEQEDYSILILKQAVLSVDSKDYIISNVRISLKVPAHYAVGIRVSAFGILKILEGPTNPGQFDKAFYYRLQDVGYTMSDPSLKTLPSRVRLLPEVLAILREAMRERIRQSYSEQTAGVISAMILGDKSLLSDEVRNSFSMGGISHILAISGLHVSLFGEGIYRLLLLLPFFRKGRKKAGGIISVFILIFYAILTGLSVATVRAVIMFTIMRGADLVGRTYDQPTAIAFAAFLIVLEQPLYVFYSGFILSFAAIVTLTVFKERSGLIIALSLFLVTLPIICWFYYEFSAYTILINLLIIPLMPVFLLFGLLGTIFGGGLGGVFSFPATALLKAVLFTLGFFRKLPFSNFIFGRPAIWQIVIYYILLAGFLYLQEKWRRRQYRFALFLLVPLLAAVLAFRVPSGLSISFLDVGQGDCCVMEMPGGQNVIVDGGSSTEYEVGKNRLIPFLKYEGIQNIDYVFVTHMDSDHCSGVKELLCAVRDGETALKVGKLVLPYLRERGEAYQEMVELGREAGAEVLVVESGDVFEFEGVTTVRGILAGFMGESVGRMGAYSGHMEAKSMVNHEGAGALTIHIFGPDPDLETSPVDENGQCITFALKYGKFDCLMTGDVQNAGEAGLIRRLRAAGIEAEVLKVAHHGSKYSTPEEFLEIVKPKISVISCGRDNWYGHPHGELLERLRGVGSGVYRTDRSGCIHIKTRGDTFTIRSKNS